MTQAQYAPSSLMEAHYARAPHDQPTVDQAVKSSGPLVYTSGLLLALILTAASFWLVNTSLLWAPGASVGLACLRSST